MTLQHREIIDHQDPTTGGIKGASPGPEAGLLADHQAGLRQGTAEGLSMRDHAAIERGMTTGEPPMTTINLGLEAMLRGRHDGA